MQPQFVTADAQTKPLIATSPEGLDATLATLTPAQAAWVRATGFAAAGGEVAVFADADGTVAGALVGLGTPAQQRRGRFLTASAASRLPAGTWALQGLSGAALEEAALGWLLEGYRFDRYRKLEAPKARLARPEGIDAARLEAIARAEFLVRDLINTPASDMGPAELAAAAEAVATEFGARFAVTMGAELAENFPLIHAVGRSAGPGRDPRLIEMSWGAIRA